MKITIGTDHRGFILKNIIVTSIDSHEFLDIGCFDDNRCDYPEFAKKVVDVVLSEKADMGILLCGSGIGMAIAANRYKGIFAGLCWSPDVAIAGRQDDNINILVLPADFISPEQAITTVRAWLNATFKGEHYQKRLEMIDSE